MAEKWYWFDKETIRSAPRDKQVTENSYQKSELSVRPKPKYVPGSGSLKNVTSTTATPTAVLNRATRPCASPTAIGKFLNSSSDQMRCQSSTDMQKNLGNGSFKYTFSFITSRIKIGFSSWGKFSDLFDKDFESPRGFAQRVPRNYSVAQTQGRSSDRPEHWGD